MNYMQIQTAYICTHRHRHEHQPRHLHIYIYICIYTYIYTCTYVYTHYLYTHTDTAYIHTYRHRHLHIFMYIHTDGPHASDVVGVYNYGVATCSRPLKITGLFCKRALWKRRYSTEETYNLKQPTNRSHPILHFRVHVLHFRPSKHILHIRPLRYSMTFSALKKYIYIYLTLKHHTFSHLDSALHLCTRCAQTCASLLYFEPLKKYIFDLHTSNIFAP